MVTQKQRAPMKAAQGRGEHWGQAVKSAVAALGRIPDEVNIGFVYVTQGLAENFSSIITFLRETTPVTQWLGAVGHGVFGPLGESYEGCALSLMVGTLPPGTFHCFEPAGDDDAESLLAPHRSWLNGRQGVTGLVHADPQCPDLAKLLASLSAGANAFLFGGLTAAGTMPRQVAGRMTDGPLSGAWFSKDIALATGLTQGCIPIGGPHRVSEAVDGVIMALDGQPAVDVMKAEAGDSIARDLSKASGLIQLALPVAGSDTHDYTVRSLLGIDPRRGWLAAAERFVPGDRVLFVRRDAEAAQKDLRRMLLDLAKRLDGRTILGGIYISCVARGPALFGTEGREVAAVFEALGDFPLVGFSASGEICHDRLYAFTGLLALFLR